MRWLSATVFLTTKSEEGAERVTTRAKIASKHGCRIYFFEEGGTRYVLRTGKVLCIERMGELSYRLCMDPDIPTQAVLSSSFGEISVQVRTHRLECASDASGERIFCEYDLDFSGFVQHHCLEFVAKRIESRK